MPIPGDPALGMTGALTALAQQPMSAAPNATPLGGGGGGDMTAAASDLSRAARGLESVQGGVAGQTMAINQMATQAQVSNTQLGTMVGQLGMQVSGLSQVVSQLSTALNMQRMGGGGGGGAFAPPPMPMMTAPPPANFMPAAPGAMSQFAGGAGSMAMGAGGMAVRGMTGFGAAMGGMGAGAAGMFGGTGVGGRAPGSMAPMMNNPGFMGNAGMGMGVGVHPSMMRQAHGGAIMQMGQERAGATAANAFMGTMGGMGQLGGILGGEAAGVGIAAGMGMSGMTGALAGSVMGLPVGMAIGAGVDETMRQGSAIRGMGGQFGRNAFRFMPGGQTQGSLRKPGHHQRQQFGAGMNRMAIEDLTFDQGDMAEMFAGASQGDLLRGTRNTQEVLTRMRQLKETVKSMGRNLGTTVQESTRILSEMQGMGFDVSQPDVGRAAIFGASAVGGMTPEAARRATMGIGARDVGAGLGMQSTAGAALGMNIAQANRGPGGTISAVNLAAAGGSEGAGASFNQGLKSFAQSDLGRATFLAGSAGGGGFDASRVAGMGARQVLAAASKNATTNDLMALQNDPSRATRELMQNPAETALMIITQAKGMAAQFKGPGVSDREAMMSAVGKITGKRGPDLSLFMQMLKGMPAGLKEEQNLKMRNLRDSIMSDTLENASISGNLSRSWQRAIRPIAEGMTETAADIEHGVGQGMGRFSRDLFGVSHVAMRKGQMNATDIEAQARAEKSGLVVAQTEGEIVAGAESAAAGSRKADFGMGAADRGASALVEGQMLRRGRARAKELNLLRGTDEERGNIKQGHRDSATRIIDGAWAMKGGRMDKLAEEIKQTKNPAKRKKLLKELMETSTEGLWGTLGNADPSTSEGKRALRLRGAVQEKMLGKYGINILAIEAGDAEFQEGISQQDKDKAEASVRGVADAIPGMTDSKATNLAVNEDFQSLLTAAADGDKDAIGVARAALLESKAMSGTEIDAAITNIANNPRLHADIIHAKQILDQYSVQVQAQSVGKRVAGVLTEAGYAGGELSTLGSGKSTRQIVEALARVSKNDKAIAKIRAVNPQLAKILGQEGREGDELKVGAQLLDELTEGGLEGVIAIGRKGLSEQQSQDVAILSSQTVRLGHILERLEKRLPQ